MATTISSGSSIKFRYGTDSALNSLRDNAKAIEVGTFYLTEDTHRMYIGVANGNKAEIVPVNEGITTYTETVPAATKYNAGQFAYIPDVNVLCVSNGENWIQLNYNTDTLYDYAGIVENTENTENSVTIKSTLKSSGDNKATDGTEEASTDTFSFVVEGKNGIIVSASDKGFEIYGQKLGCTVDGASALISLTDKDGKAVDGAGITLTADGGITFEEDETGLIIKSTDTTLDNVETHAEALSAGGFKIYAKDTDKNVSGGTIDPIIKIGATAKEVHFLSGTATLDVYTKDEVDGLRASFDAMEYQGVANAAPSRTNVKKGYTWKAGADFTLYAADGQTSVGDVFVGDLIIANIADGKTEGTDGFIAAENVKWEIVPSGNEDTTYSVETTESGIKFIEQTSTEADAEEIGALNILGSGVITATAAPTAGTSTQNITITHDEIDRNDPKLATENVNQPTDTSFVASDDYIEVIDASKGNNGIDTDDYGHITAVHTKKYVIHDTNAKLTAVGAKAAEVENSNSVNLTVSTSLQRADETTAVKKEATVQIGSSSKNIAVTSSNAASISFDLVWDTFNPVAAQ